MWMVLLLLLESMVYHYRLLQELQGSWNSLSNPYRMLLLKRLTAWLPPQHKLSITPKMLLLLLNFSLLHFYLLWHLFYPLLTFLPLGWLKDLPHAKDSQILSCVIKDKYRQDLLISLRIWHKEVLHYPWKLQWLQDCRQVLELDPTQFS